MFIAHILTYIMQIIICKEKKSLGQTRSILNIETNHFNETLQHSELILNRLGKTKTLVAHVELSVVAS